MFIIARQLNTHPSASHKSRLKATHTQPQDTHRSTQGCGARLRSTLVQSMPAKNATCIWERRIRRTTSSNFKKQCTPKDFSIKRILTKHLSPSFVDGAPPESWSEHVSPRAGTTHFFCGDFHPRIGSILSHQTTLRPIHPATRPSGPWSPFPPKHHLLCGQEWNKHWQTGTEAQKLCGKLWNNRNLSEKEEVRPPIRLK